MSSPADPLTPAPWLELADRWQQALLQWTQWWQVASAPPMEQRPAQPANGPAPRPPARTHAHREAPPEPARANASSSHAERAPGSRETAGGARGDAPHVPAPDPAALAELNARFAARYESLWAAAGAALASPGAAMPEVVAPAPGDRRFASPAWRDQPFYAYLKQAYLLYSEYLSEAARLVDLPPDERRRLQFATRQWLDAVSPTNFAATNPDVLARAIETEGGSFVQGLQNLVGDAGRGRITMSDESAFAVGRNLAVTPGSVVFRNDLIELIQYDASTPKVARRPLLMVPPCINKFYILDLTPANSLVRHAVAAGRTTFMISWRNVPASLGGLTWDDYLEQGPLAALRAVREISGSRTVDALGFCVGGTMLACALAVLAARRDTTVASATLLTTMLDFADPGDIGVYVSRESIAAREPALCGGTRMPGSALAGAFASLRANELVWNYVVNNYLKGRTPPAFDLLYWNADSANLAGPMMAYYLREMYVENRLREPNALTMLGDRIDLSRIDIPAYVYASRDDHIVPWRSAYRTTSLLGGDVTFVLGASGHIAGVINPPVPVKRSYWVNDLLTDDPDDWLARAREVKGSWWTHWDEWMARHAGATRRAPRTAGSAACPPLMAAPGRYVLERPDD